MREVREIGENSAERLRGVRVGHPRRGSRYSHGCATRKRELLLDGGRTLPITTPPPSPPQNPITNTSHLSRLGHSPSTPKSLRRDPAILAAKQEGLSNVLAGKIRKGTYGGQKRGYNQVRAVVTDRNACSGLTPKCGGGCRGESNKKTIFLHLTLTTASRQRGPFKSSREPSLGDKSTQMQCAYRQGK